MSSDVRSSPSMQRRLTAHRLGSRRGRVNVEMPAMPAPIVLGRANRKSRSNLAAATSRHSIALLPRAKTSRSTELNSLDSIGASPARCLGRSLVIAQFDGPPPDDVLQKANAFNTAWLRRNVSPASPAFAAGRGPRSRSSQEGAGSEEISAFERLSREGLALGPGYRRSMPQA